MKKNVFLALLMLVVAFSTVSCKKEVKKNDLKDNGLNGKVKYIEIKTYSVSNNFGGIQKGKLLKYDFKSFNKDGNYLNIIDGSLGGKDIYKYDSKGNWIEEIEKNEMEIPIKITERKIVYYGDADEYNYPEWDSETFNGLRVESNY